MEITKTNSENMCTYICSTHLHPRPNTCLQQHRATTSIGTIKDTMIPTKQPIDSYHLTSTNRLHDPWKNAWLKIMPEYGETDWMKQDSWQLTLLAQLQPMEGWTYCWCRHNFFKASGNKCYYNSQIKENNFPSWHVFTARKQWTIH
jgi:hypothetical protein